MAAAYWQYRYWGNLILIPIPMSRLQYRHPNGVLLFGPSSSTTLFHLENSGSCTNKSVRNIDVHLEQEMKQQNSFKSRTVHLILIMLINHSKKQNLDMYLQLLPSQAHQNQSWPTGGMETLFGPLVPAVFLMVFVAKMFCMLCTIQEKISKLVLLY